MGSTWKAMLALTVMFLATVKTIFDLSYPETAVRNFEIFAVFFVVLVASMLLLRIKVLKELRKMDKRYKGDSHVQH